jgi:hypothetical protein
LISLQWNQDLVPLILVQTGCQALSGLTG